jgi:hypothetical protein
LAKEHYDRFGVWDRNRVRTTALNQNEFAEESKRLKALAEVELKKAGILATAN